MTSEPQAIRFICPMPDVWADVHGRLHRAWKAAKNRAIPEPPVPLILGAWNFASDADKATRWSDTVRWAERHGFLHLISTIRGQDAYQVSSPDSSTSGAPKSLNPGLKNPPSSLLMRYLRSRPPE
jgi:hypothetical protein